MDVDSGHPPPPPEVLAAWPSLEGQPAAPVAIGNINRTYRVEGRAGAVILQRVHPIFGDAVHEDIEAVTAHLEQRGLVTPRLLRTGDGGLCMRDHGDHLWRAMTCIDGVCVEKLHTVEQAAAAGELVGRFHLAVADLAHAYRFTRAGVHDTSEHLSVLREAVHALGAHRLHSKVASAAEDLIRRADALADLSSLPRRHSHGDLKVSNLIFDEDGAGRCLIDLDTLGLMIWPFELGDALRSWCNPRREDERPAALRTDLFEAAVRRYADAVGELITDDERAVLVCGLETICLELAARFLADALREQYFGYDAARYPAAGEHHLARGEAMLELASSVDAQRGTLERLVRDAWST